MSNVAAAVLWLCSPLRLRARGADSMNNLLEIVTERHSMKQFRRRGMS